jgi:hypothetical protein
VAGDLLEGAALGAQVGQQRVGVADEPQHLFAAFGQHGGGVVGVGQQVAQLGVADIESLRKAGDALDSGFEVGRGVRKVVG